MRQTDILRTAAGLPAVIFLAVVVTAISAKAPMPADKSDTYARPQPRVTETKLNANKIPRSVQVAPPSNKLAAAADYALPWHSFNGGGIVAGSSPTHGLGDAIGQTFAERGSSAGYGLEFGFFAGAAICNCENQGDFDEDGFITALDLGSMIDVLFAGAPDIRDPNCPTTRLDFPSVRHKTP